MLCLLCAYARSQGSALSHRQRQDHVDKNFWFDSVLLILRFDEFLLPANFAKRTMALHQGKGNRAVMHAANQLRDTLPNLFLCQTTQQMTTGWYKWVLLAEHEKFSTVNERKISPPTLKTVPGPGFFSPSSTQTSRLDGTNLL